MTEENVLKIALVDDSALIRDRVAALLSAINGVAVIWQAADVAAGKWLLAEQNPDVLILDIELAGESGLEILRTANLHARPPVTMMLTTDDHPRLRERCAELGASFFFFKPTETYKTIDICRAMARRHNQAAESGPVWRQIYEANQPAAPGRGSSGANTFPNPALFS